MSKPITFLQGIWEAQFEEMTRDESVILLGQDMEANLYGASDSFVQTFGRQRVRDLPISEAASVGLAAGAALTGLRPILDLTMSNFIYNAMDQIVNQVAKNRYMFGGQSRLPVVIRTNMFYQGGNAAHHSDRPYPMLMHTPGLIVLAPTTGADLKGLLKSAVRNDNPVVCFEDANLWSVRGRGVPDNDDEDYLVPIGTGRIRRAGTDVTIVGIAAGVATSLTAAQQLAASGVDAEVIDPRSLVPMDWALIVSSVARTGRLVVVDPANRTCGAAAEIIAVIVERCYGDLRCAPAWVTTPDVPVPFAKVLEDQLYPTPSRVVAAVAAMPGLERAGSDAP